MPPSIRSVLTLSRPDWATKRRKSMKRGTTMLSALAVIWALALPSWAQVKELPTTTETISGTIETIDKNKRAMNIKTADGTFVAVSVPKSVIRFDQFKVGDKLKATYNNNVIVRLKPVGEKAVDTAEKSTVRDQTSGKAAMVRRMTATIAEIDKSASSITFVGPNGWKYSRRVGAPTVIDQVEVCHPVHIAWDTELS